MSNHGVTDRPGAGRLSGDEVLLGVDLATANTRVVAADATGTVLATAARPLATPSRPRAGWSEQEPTYVDVVLEALAEVVGALPGGGRRIAGISVTATSGTIVPCTPDGTPTGAALLYDDQRSAADLPTEVVAAAPALARVAWLVRHRPAARYLHVSDVVVSALTGEAPVTDTSHALKTGADPTSAMWRRELMTAAGVDPSWLPQLVRPGTVVGGVSTGIAARTGLVAGTPVIVGMTDGCTGQLAAGAVAPGEAASTLGTTLVLKQVAPDQVTALDGAVYSHRAPDGSWWAGGASNVGAGVLSAVLPDVDKARWDQIAGEHGPARVVCYPLARPGERFPFARPDAALFWEGKPADDVETYRALLEGVAFTERLGYEVLHQAGAPALTGAVRGVGGGSRSQVWLRIRASVLQRPLTVPAEPSSGFGAAVLAAAATVHDGLAQAVKEMVHPVQLVEPDPAEIGPLDAAYHRFLAALRRRGYLPDSHARP